MADVNFLNLDSLAVIGGATLAVSAITNTIQALVRITSPWVPFVASALVVVAVGLANNALKSGTGVLIAFANVSVLFCTASGIQGLAIHVASAVTSNKPKPALPDGREPARLRSWFHAR